MPDTEVSVRWPARYNTIPKDVFHRRDVYEAELSKIFYGPEWHPLAHVSEIPEKGDFKTMQIGEAPVLIVHGDDDKLNPLDKTGRKTAAAIRGSELKIYEGGPHGLIITDRDRFTQDLLAFTRA